MEHDFGPNEMRRLVQQIGKPIYGGEKVDTRIRRVARLLDLNDRTAKAYWYCEKKPELAHIIAAKKLCGEPIGGAATNELKQLQDQFDALSRELAKARQDIDCLMAAADRERAIDRRSETNVGGGFHRPVAG